jgi:DNA-directed RNA polymerase subunit H (RpoH/RPB5)
MSTDPDHLIVIKKETIRMMARRGYILSPEDEALLSYTGDDLAKSFLEYAHGTATSDTKNPYHNPVRNYLKNTAKLGSIRTMLSTTYKRPIDKPAAGAGAAREDFEQCIVYFADIPDLNVLKIDDYRVLSNMLVHLGAGARHGILISPSGIASGVAKEIRCLGIPEPKRAASYVEHFEDRELLSDPDKHMYAPVMTLLTHAEAAVLIERDKIKLSQLHKIGIEDPQAKRLGALPGRVVKVVRPNLVSGTLLDEEMAYRIVVAPPTDRKVAKK